MIDITKSNLYQRIINPKNIYLSIYKLDSYVFNPELLSDEDYVDFLKLSDKFDKNFIEERIEKIQDIIKDIFINDRFFEIAVYLNPKKYESYSERFDNNGMVYRPLHTSDLNSLIAMVSMLNVLIYENHGDNLILSEIAYSLPNNFYGNIPSEKAEQLFIPWLDQYRKYSQDIASFSKKCKETLEYKFEVTLDLKNFFPSINPLFIYEEILKSYSYLYKEEDSKVFEILIFKLLFFIVKDVNKIKQNYYINYESLPNNFNFSQGIPQGLPQSYLFGNIFMTKVARIFNNHFRGKSFFYVDDSVIFTNSLEDISEFNGKLEQLNKDLSQYNKYIIDNNKDGITVINNHLEQLNILTYDLKVHLSGKSNINCIKNSKSNQYYLSDIMREASKGGSNLFKNLSEEEDDILLSQFLNIRDSILKELEAIRETDKDISQEYDNQREHYVKMLIRLKKFYDYRIMKLQNKNKVEVDDNDFDFLSIFNIQENDDVSIDKLNRFMECYQDEIVLLKIINLFETDMSKRDEDIQHYINIILNFDILILGKNSVQFAYLTKFISHLRKKSEVYYDKNKFTYKSIVEEINIKYRYFLLQQKKKRYSS